MKRKSEMLEIDGGRLRACIRESKLKTISRTASKVKTVNNGARSISRSYLSQCISAGYIDSLTLDGICQLLDIAPAFFTLPDPVYILRQDPDAGGVFVFAPPPYSLQGKLSRGLTMQKVFSDLFIFLGYPEKEAFLYAEDWPALAPFLLSAVNVYTSRHKVQKDAAGVIWHSVAPGKDPQG